MQNNRKDTVNTTVTLTRELNNDFKFFARKLGRTGNKQAIYLIEKFVYEMKKGEKNELENDRRDCRSF